MSCVNVRLVSLLAGTLKLQPLQQHGCRMSTFYRLSSAHKLKVKATHISPQWCRKLNILAASNNHVYHRHHTFKSGCSHLLRVSTQGTFRSVKRNSHYDKWTNLCFEDLEALIGCGDIQLFDVREPKEISDTGKIPCAVNIPLGQIKEALLMADDVFLEKYSVPKPALQDTNIVFVGLGPIKSSAALEIAHKIGFKKARHYYGGYKEWIQKTQTSTEEPPT
ncbi:thiosulfate sulfurtransferase/rhodanese-like domain-containing protein 3 [Argonauta hians]